MWANSSVAFITPRGISYLTGNKVKGTLKIRCHFCRSLFTLGIGEGNAFFAVWFSVVLLSLPQWRDLCGVAIHNIPNDILVYNQKLLTEKNLPRRLCKLIFDAWVIPYSMLLALSEINHCFVHNFLESNVQCDLH